VDLNGENLDHSDDAAVTDESAIKAKRDSEVLLFDLA
jgi:hypothetical protein